MPYKPKFCCQCATPIERSNWTLLTSRRFCDLCETDHKLETYISRSIIVIVFAFGIFGVGTWLRKPEKPLNLVSANSTITNKSAINSQTSVNANVQTFAKIQESNLAAQTPAKFVPDSPKPVLKTQKSLSQTTDAQETIYFCGAETKKGTPCSRRMKGNIRCWQHEGKPAMLPTEKLVASR